MLGTPATPPTTPYFANHWYKYKTRLLLTYWVLHDIWLMCHPRMTLYLTVGQTGRERQNETQMQRKELLNEAAFEISLSSFFVQYKYKNVISLNNTFSLQFMLWDIDQQGKPQNMQASRSLWPIWGFLRRHGTRKLRRYCNSEGVFV